MLLFLIKKTFFDMWDHLLSIILLNFGAILLFGGILSLRELGDRMSPLALGGSVVLGGLLLCLYLGVLSSLMGDIAGFKTPQLQRFLPYLKEVWPVSLLLAGFLAMQVIVAFAIYWYASLKSLFGIAIAATLFWAGLVLLLSCQYLFPFWKQVNKKLKILPSKCLLLFFDNVFFTIFLAFGAMALLMVSGFTVFLFPGISTVLLWYQVALRLRMYKYDYLEAHPEASRKKIPWQELIAEDRQRVGQRTLRGMIFPWKE